MSIVVCSVNNICDLVSHNNFFSAPDSDEFPREEVGDVQDNIPRKTLPMPN